MNKRILVTGGAGFIGTNLVSHLLTRHDDCDIVVLGLRAGRPFEAGLEETVRWYGAHRTWWERLLPMRRVAVLGKDGATGYY